MKVEEKKVEKPEESKKASSIGVVEQKARFNLLASVYKDIPDEEPPAYQFSANLPELYSLDLDIIRLTAQYTAVNGRKVCFCVVCDV